jgi:hypothetical protein
MMTEELDDIERVLDHAGNMGWKPFEYFKNAQATDYESFLRGAEAYQEWLAKQCWPEPCGECTHKWLCSDEKRKHICDQHVSWLGQRQGYAKGQRDLAKEIDDFLSRLANNCKLGSPTDEGARWLAGQFMAYRAEKGLQERGK